MDRILIKDTLKHIGKKVKVCGWVNNWRAHGKVLFVDLRDRSGVLQVVFVSQNQPSYKTAESLRQEWVVSIEGNVKERPKGMQNPKIQTGTVELEAENIEILSKADSIPFDFIAEELDLKLPTLLDTRPLNIRNNKIKSIFKISGEIINGFREAMAELDFTEFQSPNIVPAAAEGGAEIFHIDYYDYDAYLAQSPQLYKQIMLGAFERVFTIAHVYRAEPSVTTRHLSEYTSLDLEMAFIDSWEELMDVCEKVIKKIIERLEKNCQKDLEMHSVSFPKIGETIPKIKIQEAQEIIFQRTKRDNRKAPDLEPEDEKEICQWAKEKHNSDFVFITHYPVKKRPFYTFPDPENKDQTLSFDLLFRGLEIVTGGQRINDYNQLLKNIKKWGNDPKTFSFYLQAFKYGMPPEGGFAIGLERMVKQILELKNVREALPFPRDMERVDQRLSLLQKKEKKGKRKTNKK